MSRRPMPENEESAQDSFLDVVANLVGVIIILVMLVGTKSVHDIMQGSTTAKKPAPQQSTTKLDLAGLRSEVAEARERAKRGNSEIEALAKKILQLQHETADFEQRRVELAMHQKLVEEDMALRKQNLTAEQQNEFEAQRKIAAARIRLDELTKERIALLSAPADVEELECVPTPLAREVDEDSIHLRVKDGLVSIVPLNELLNEVQIHVDEIRQRLHQRGEVVETYGPIDNYRIRMTVSRVLEVGAGPQAGKLQRITYDQYAEILPTRSGLGQDVEIALTPGSEVYQYLESRRRTSPAVVVWLYTDSFNDFRLIKRVLWEMGFSIATRPMEPQHNIGISPHGSKAAAQ